ncbi:MAG: hypothetical protein LBV54_08130 [Puniceicoccales bacterium]|jgi:hypothetical protein|nr:hypothetical protein [Puniceicoccales bacterium]
MDNITDNTSTTTPDGPVAKKKPFYKRASGRFLLCALVLFAATSLFVSFSGKMMPGIVAGYIKAKSGYTFSVGENNTSLLAGRVDFQNVRLVNSPEFHDPRFLDIARIKAEIKLSSLLENTREYPELALDIRELVLISESNSLLQAVEKNNLVTFINAFTDEQDDAATQPADKKDKSAKDEKKTRKKFHIDKLSLKFDRFIVLVGDTSGKPAKTLIDGSGVFDVEITDVTEKNIREKILKVIERLIKSKAASSAADRLGREASALGSLLGGKKGQKGEEKK